MAELFGLAASVFATIQIADRVIGLCKHYIESVRDAPSDLRALLIEISTLKAILENVRFLIECSQDQSTLGSLDGDLGPIKECHRNILELEGLFPNEPKRKIQATIESLAWPLKQNKVNKIRQDIATNKHTITMAMTTDAL